MAINCPLYDPVYGWYILVPGPNNSLVAKPIVSPSHYFKSMGVDPPMNNFEDDYYDDDYYEDAYYDDYYYEDDYYDDYNYEDDFLPSTQLPPSSNSQDLLQQSYLSQPAGMVQSSHLSSHAFLPPVAKAFTLPVSSTNLSQDNNPLTSSIPNYSLMSSNSYPTTSSVLQAYSSASLNDVSNLLSHISHACNQIQIFPNLGSLLSKPLHGKKSMPSPISHVESLSNESTMLALKNGAQSKTSSPLSESGLNQMSPGSSM